MASPSGSQQSEGLVTCPTCDYTVTQAPGKKRTICPNCGNFYSKEAADIATNYRRNRPRQQQNDVQSTNVSTQLRSQTPCLRPYSYTVENRECAFDFSYLDASLKGNTYWRQFKISIYKFFCGMVGGRGFWANLNLRKGVTQNAHVL